MEVACARRLQQELGMSCELEFVYKFQYYAKYAEVGAESELCHVYIGKTANQPKPNPGEIAATQWLSFEQLEQGLIDSAGQYTPWFKQEWAELKAQHWAQVQKLFKGN